MAMVGGEGSVDDAARTARTNLTSSLKVTHDLTLNADAPAVVVLHQMNSVLSAVVASNFDPRSLQAVGALYETIGKVQQQMMDNSHNLAFSNFARSFAVVLEEAVRRDGKSGDKNNNNTSGTVIVSKVESPPAIRAPTPATTTADTVVKAPHSLASLAALQRCAPAEPVLGGRAAAAVRQSEKPEKPQARRNISTDFSFKPIPEDVASKKLLISLDKLECFHGASSWLTTQHKFPIRLDRLVYTSADHYYQIEKCKQLVGKDCPSLTAAVQKEEEYSAKKPYRPSNYGAQAREFLKENKIPQASIEAWRRTGGVLATYRAMRAKAEQSEQLRKCLRASADRIFLHTYPNDTVFGAGVDEEAAKLWATEMEKSGGKIQIPLEPLVNAERIAMAPQVAKGRNLLGLIHMQLAHEFSKSMGAYGEPTAATKTES